jgi:aspartyl-tRNA(Asn)/glutamyl-tRNA(Gln) amidotransferase subunit A
MQASEICFLSLAETAGLVERREVSPVELTRLHLDRIAALDGRVHAYITVLADNAMEEAQRAEEEILRGEYRGPLHGIPVAVKDLFITRGVLTTAGSRVLASNVPDDDASAVVRLREAGAVLLGKLSLHEFALGGPDLKSPFAPARNPWNLDHVPGGSSSGSGAAVAAGMAVLALGTDTAGSVRMPASCCGVVGLKPTYGRVSRYGVLPLSWTLDHVGPLTRTVEDAALVLQAIAGYDPRDPGSSREPVPDFGLDLGKGVKGIRVGVPRDMFYDADQVKPEVLELLERAQAEFGRLGALVEEVTIPSIREDLAVRGVIRSTETYAYHEKTLRETPELFGSSQRVRFLGGVFYTARDYLRAQQARRLIIDEWQQVLRRVDVLITPTMPEPPVRFAAGAAGGGGPRLQGPFNLTGVPAISVPCGFSSDGLPIGMQIAGRYFDEQRVLGVAHAYEQATEWHRRHPALT